MLGLINSSFSTLIAQLLAARIGRDAIVDWMTVANIPARDGVLTFEPTVHAVMIGILFHQWADFSWTLVFFGLFGRWTTHLSPRSLLLLAPFWRSSLRASNGSCWCHCFRFSSRSFR